MILEAENALEHRIDEQLVGLEVPVPDADGAGGRSQRVSTLAAMQFLLAIEQGSLGLAPPPPLDHQAGDQHRLADQ